MRQSFAGRGPKSDALEDWLAFSGASVLAEGQAVPRRPERPSKCCCW